MIFINVIKRDPQVQIKVKDNSDKYIKLHTNYQLKKWYDTLIQNVVPKEMINLMRIIIVDIDIGLKMKISRIKYLESRILWLCKFISI